MASRHHIGTNTFVVERKQRFVVYEVDSAHSVAHFTKLLDEGRVHRGELVSGGPVAFDECVTNEHRTRSPVVDPVVTDSPPGHDGQAIQSDPLEGHSAATPSVPGGLAVEAFHEMLAQLLGPLGLDVGGNATPEPRRVDQFGNHHPAGRLLCQSRAGHNRKLRAVRSVVLAGLTITHAKVRQQPGQHRLMHTIGMAVFGAHANADGRSDLTKLAVEIVPLTNPQVVEVFGATESAELT